MLNFIFGMFLLLVGSLMLRIAKDMAEDPNYLAAAENGYTLKHCLGKTIPSHWSLRDQPVREIKTGLGGKWNPDGTAQWVVSKTPIL